MMKAPELRIGNLIEAISPSSWLYHAGQIQVEEITQFGVNLSSGDHTVYEWDNIRPIPLTEEWLTQFAFEKDEDGFFILEIGRKSFSISPNEDNHVVYRHDIGLSYTSIHNGLEYVHQLQNLYYALTGEELQLK